MAMARIAITLEDFLAHAEQLTDQVLLSGVPLEIAHEGRILRLVPETAFEEHAPGAAKDNAPNASPNASQGKAT